MTSGKQLQRLSWSQLLTKSVDGRGLAYASAVPYTHSWVSDGTGLMSGHLYCKVIAAGCNLLPTQVRGTWGKSWEGRNQSCDCCGLSQFKTLGHISQVCPRSWSPRNCQHNRLSDWPARNLEKKGFTVLKETIMIMEVDIVHYCFMLNETSAELLRMMVMMKAGRWYSRRTLLTSFVQNYQYNIEERTLSKYPHDTANKHQLHLILPLFSLSSPWGHLVWEWNNS